MVAGTDTDIGRHFEFCRGETTIQDASRPIAQREVEACAAAGIEYIELPVAYDALSVVVNPRNDWANCMTVAELRKIWEPAAQGTVTRWNNVRPEWPDQPLRLYGPGPDSGTFDYFTEAVNGQARASRGDYTPSEDDNVLVQGVSGDRYALGYFGLAYFEENSARVKAVAIDGGKGCVEPSAEAVEAERYVPLSRPLLIYVKKSEADRPEVRAFVDFYLDNVAFLAREVGYVRFPDRLYPLIKQRWASRTTGSMYAGAPPGATLEQLLQRR